MCVSTGLITGLQNNAQEECLNTPHDMDDVYKKGTKRILMDNNLDEGNQLTRFPLAILLFDNKD